jgi:mannose-6-phosphate isomerase-like protein (cupin superfamily)
VDGRSRRPAELTAVIRIVRAADRYRSEQPGIVSWYCFSAGVHYDPDNVAFGPIIGVDEHLVAPGAGFDWHAHSGVDIVSWVLAGVLRHEDSTGNVRLVAPGDRLVQSTGSGVRHTETNASVGEPLRFIQTTLLDPGRAHFAVWTVSGRVDAGRSHLFVASGAWQLEGQSLQPGDSVRSDEPLAVAGNGELLVWTVD